MRRRSMTLGMGRTHPPLLLLLLHPLLAITMAPPHQTMANKRLPRAAAATEAQRSQKTFSRAGTAITKPSASASSTSCFKSGTGSSRKGSSPQTASGANSNAGATAEESRHLERPALPLHPHRALRPPHRLTSLAPHRHQLAAPAYSRAAAQPTTHRQHHPRREGAVRWNL